MSTTMRRLACTGVDRGCCYWARRHAVGLNSSPIRQSPLPAGESVPALDVNANAVALLPGSVMSRGVLRVAIPTNEPPTQFYKEGSRYLTGVNPDIARLIGEALGARRGDQSGQLRFHHSRDGGRPLRHDGVVDDTHRQADRRHRLRRLHAGRQCDRRREGQTAADSGSLVRQTGWRPDRVLPAHHQHP